MASPMASPVPALQSRTYDWPLSKVEKKDLLITNHRNSFDDCQVQIKDLKERMQSEPMHTPCKLEFGSDGIPLSARRQSIESGVSTSNSVNSNKSWSDEEVKQSLQSFQEQLMQQQAQQMEVFQQQQKQQMEQMLAALSKGAGRADGQGVNLESPVRKQGRSCPPLASPAPEESPNTPRHNNSALKHKRHSRGTSISRVRFAVEDLGTDSDEEGVVNTASAARRGRDIGHSVRNRRMSRGPDGKSYHVSPGKPRKEAAQPSEVNTTGGTVRGGVVGGVAGWSTGAVLGTVCAIPAAFFTFGLALPIGAAIGGGVGAGAGAGVGAAVGYKMSNGQSTTAEDKEDKNESDEEDEDKEDEAEDDARSNDEDDPIFAKDDVTIAKDKDAEEGEDNVED